MLIQPMGATLNQTTFLTQAQALFSKHTTQQNAEVKSTIKPDRQVASKRMPLGARLAVNAHNMGGRFVESVKIARWSMSPQVAGDGLESIIEFQVQIKGHNQREYEDKWQGWQNWTDEKLATKLTKDDQQPVLSLPARWWPDTLQEFESGGWWQRPHTRVKCRQRKCSLVENLSLRSSKCHGCEKQMKTNGKRLNSIVFTNADLRYAGKLDDQQGGDTTILKQSHDNQSRNERQIKWIPSWPNSVLVRHLIDVLFSCTLQCYSYSDTSHNTFPRAGWDTLIVKIDESIRSETNVPANTSDTHLWQRNLDSPSCMRRDLLSSPAIF